ncbi:MAG: hypothetical protein IKC83_01630 [Clostridia bacterium]|nr:hypothetical protein [Clostridia bacterium]
MRNYKEEYQNRTEFIKNLVKNAGAKGVVFGNSGGKDCALVGALCQGAGVKAVGVIMPCMSRRNYEEDMRDGIEVANHFGFETRIVDISPARQEIVKSLENVTDLTPLALANINPRVRILAVMPDIEQTTIALAPISMDIPHTEWDIASIEFLMRKLVL